MYLDFRIATVYPMHLLLMEKCATITAVPTKSVMRTAQISERTTTIAMCGEILPTHHGKMKIFLSNRVFNGRIF